MGQSTDAILVYGVDLGEDELPEALVFNDEDDGDTEESKPIAYALYMGRPLPSGVTIVNHCSDSCTMRIIAIEASELRAWRGHPKEVPTLVAKPEWDAAIDEFAAEHGITLPKRPAWLLASWWS